MNSTARPEGAKFSSVSVFLSNHGGTVFLFAVLSLSLCVNVLLARRLWQLTTPPPAGIEIGNALPPIAAIDKDGKSTLIGFTTPQPTVLYILSPLCAWCKRNEANMAALASAKGAQYRFIGLSVTPHGLQEYWNTVPTPFPIYQAASLDQVTNLRFSDLTPQMAFVSSDGKVEKVWAGALMGNLLSDVEQFFDVKLPGVVNEVPTIDELR